MKDQQQDKLNERKMASNILNAVPPSSRHNAKASVFTNLVSEAEYLWQLYKCLHPEDEGVTAEDLTLPWRCLPVLSAGIRRAESRECGFCPAIRGVCASRHKQRHEKSNINSIFHAFSVVSSNPVHHIKNLFLLAFDDQAHLLAQSLQIL